MRFNSRKKNFYIITRKWFAFIPIKINKEVRWLESVKVRGYYYSDNHNKWSWRNIEFVD